MGFTIKDMRLQWLVVQVLCFDSILVRLKERISLKNWTRYSRFDSILVRLKDADRISSVNNNTEVSIPYWFD